jgi:hypothetical protein
LAVGSWEKGRKQRAETSVGSWQLAVGEKGESKKAKRPKNKETSIGNWQKGKKRKKEETKKQLNIVYCAMF